MPAFSMGKAPRGKEATTTPMTTPGPGSYAPGKTDRMTIPKWSMGRAERNNLYNSSVSPGPGAYERVSKFTGPKYHFGGRHTQSLSNLAPGPGQYTPETRFRDKLTTFKYSIVGKHATGRAQSAGPGPGSYNFSSIKVHRGGKFSRDQRRSLALSQGIIVPGPGAYESSKRISSSVIASPRYTFGLKTPDGRTLSGRGVPGPGSYSIRNVIGTEGAKLTIIPRRPDSAPIGGRGCPGPGAYTPGGITHKAPPSYKIGTATRCKLSVEEIRVPGPGAYNPGDKLVSYRQVSPGWGLGTSQRGPLSYVSQGPGPGNYSIKEKLGEGPKHSMRPRTAVIMRNAVPGPGQYTPSKTTVLLRPPSAVMGSGTRGENFASTRGAPGPGAYLQSGSIVKNGPSFSFGGSRPGTAGKADSKPGPGAYRVPCTFASLPKYSIAQRVEYEYV